jgi:3-isopropylmalate/(R)-2-methylmalate dehydratase small subunit
MKPFTRLTAVAAPLDLANIDTDKIFPSRFGRKIRTPQATYGPFLFYDMRFGADGEPRADFVLNQPGYRDAAILVAGANFGCGSSREAAVYALVDSGVRSVIAPSFGDIHYANQLQNGMLPVILPEDVCHGLCAALASQPGAALSIDLASQTVTAPDGARHAFQIDGVYRERLMNGVDDIGLVLEYADAIDAYETRRRREKPWLPRTAG